MSLQFWQIALPRLSKAIGSSVSGEDVYEIEMHAAKHDFHPAAAKIPVWCYRDKNPGAVLHDQTYLGPIIEATVGTPVRVTWINNLPTDKKFPYTQVIPHIVGPSGHGGMMPPPKPGHAVVHLHGARCTADSDGFPEDYLHPQEPPGSPHGTSSAVYRYPNAQPGATFWYHDHTMGITRLNVYAGMAGMYLLRDANEAALNLPRDAYEIPVVLQDRMFDLAGSKKKMHYEVSSAQPEFFGDHVVVNGAVWPFMKAEQRRYRLRMVNGSNSRFYRLRLRRIGGSGAVPTVYQIGGDGGFLAAPVAIMGSGLPLILAPGERADVIIDCSACTVNDEILLENDAVAPYDPDPGEILPAGDPMRNVLKFIIVPISGSDSSIIPASLPSDFSVDIGATAVPLVNVPAVRAALAAADLPPIKVRKIKLIENHDLVSGDPVEVLLNNLGFHDPITEDPRLDGIEIWEIDNTTADVHPIHIHLIQFLALDRGGDATAIDINERGWKDTFRCNPGEVTRLIMRFTDYVGRYVWHCHMLEHEDHDMMRPLLVRT